MNNFPDVYSVIRRSIMEINSPYNDGFTAECCKKELWMLKCWLEEQYADLPSFGSEREWEQQRLLTKLKQTNGER